MWEKKEAVKAFLSDNRLFSQLTENDSILVNKEPSRIIVSDMLDTRGHYPLNNAVAGGKSPATPRVHFLPAARVSGSGGIH